MHQHPLADGWFTVYYKGVGIYHSEGTVSCKGVGINHSEGTVSCKGVGINHSEGTVSCKGVGINQYYLATVIGHGTFKSSYQRVLYM